MSTPCQQFEKKMGLYITGEMPEKEKKVLEDHIHNCEACSLQLARYRQTRELIIKNQLPTPIPDWDESWLSIRQNMIIRQQLQNKRQRVILPLLKWGGAVAGTLIIFIVGLLVGYKLNNNSPNRNLPEAASLLLVQELQMHIENIKPVLIEYANYWNTTQSPQELPVEKARVLDLLKQNQLLLCRISGDHNRQIQQLLSELNSILTQIALISWEDPESLTQIKKMIRQKGLLFKMDALRPVSEKETSL